MNVYEKLNEARIKFIELKVKKSGKNDYAGYTYYELADILPAVNQIAKELKFTCVINFGKEEATLSFIDNEKPEDKILFTSPMSEANLKGCHAVQNVGATETYLKRYLYQNCFEIVEADVLDMTMGKEIEEMIQKVQFLMEHSDWDDKQVGFAQKAIACRSEKMLRIIIEKSEQKKTA